MNAEGLDTVGPFIALIGLFFTVCLIICACKCCETKQLKKNLEGEYEPYMKNTKDPDESMNIENGLQAKPPSVTTKSLETSPPETFLRKKSQSDAMKHLNEGVFRISEVTNPTYGKPSHEEEMIFNDLKAIYSYSKALITGPSNTGDTVQVNEISNVPKLANCAIDDWSKLTNFAYFYLTLFTADK